MPSTTYYIRFTLRQPKPGVPYEEQEQLHLADAFAALKLFAEPDSRWMYSRIELTEHDWEECTETLIAALEFTA